MYADKHELAEALIRFYRKHTPEHITPDSIVGICDFYFTDLASQGAREEREQGGEEEREGEAGREETSVSSFVVVDFFG